MVKYNGRPAPSIPHSIIVIVAPVDRRGRFSARLFDGRPLITSSRAAFCAAARQLLKLWFDPEMALLMRHEGSSAVALRSTIGIAAALTVEESTHGPIFRPFRGAPQSAVAAPPIRRIAVPLSGVPSP